MDIMKPPKFTLVYYQSSDMVATIPPFTVSGGGCGGDGAGGNNTRPLYRFRNLWIYLLLSVTISSHHTQTACQHRMWI
jgi:hypothetical protein